MKKFYTNFEFSMADVCRVSIDVLIESRVFCKGFKNSLMPNSICESKNRFMFGKIFIELSQIRHLKHQYEIKLSFCYQGYV